MTRLLTMLCALFVANTASWAATPPSKILFGSCAHQDKSMPILDAVIAEQPDLFVFLGDNIYGDTQDMTLLAQKYATLGAKPRFKKLRATTPLIAIWDDHDFGANDAGADYPQKQASKAIMLDFWQEPAGSSRRKQTDGIYTSYLYGKGEQQVHLILPDLRYNRAPLHEVSTLDNISKRLPKDMGPYQITPNASMLGENQWQWLEKELKKPARIKVIASSLQLLPEFTGWEAWANFPADRERLLGLLKKHKINGVLIISGDTHWGELSMLKGALDYPLWEVTSSGLTQEWKQVSPNQHRIGEPTSNVNYGYLYIDWQPSDPVLRFGLKNETGQQVLEQVIQLSEISPY